MGKIRRRRLRYLLHCMSLAIDRNDYASNGFPLTERFGAATLELQRTGEDEKRYCLHELLCPRTPGDPYLSLSYPLAPSAWMLRRPFRAYRRPT